MHTLRRLFSHLAPYRQMLILSGVVLLARAGLQLVPPLFHKRIVDEAVQGQDLRRLGMSVGLLVGVYAMVQLARIADNYLRHVLGQQFILDLRVRLYEYLQQLSLSFFERTSTGELMSRATNDVHALEQFVTHGSAQTAANLIQIAGAAIVLGLLDWRLAAWALAPVPILAVSLRFYNQRVHPVYRSARDRLGDINARLQDSLAGMKVIQAFGQEDRALERFVTESRNYYDVQVRGIRFWSTFSPAMGFVASLGTAAVLGAGAAKVVQGELSLGTVAAFLGYLSMLYSPIQNLVEIDNVFQQAIAAGERIFELLDEESDIVDAPDAVPLSPLEGHVAFEDVHFAYDHGSPVGRHNGGSSIEEEAREVLQHVTFQISPGEVVALVGPSGAGKTSIANLVCRFYDPKQGRVTIDGYDLRHVTLDSLRSQIAVVLQDTFLFNASIRENLLFGKPSATEEELVSAAKAAYAHDFIMAFDDGYDTEIGERGLRLSGGQKQRLALARAILADPRILILDEATSSVDAEAEYLIQQALESVLEGRTALVIAHRLSTIRNADKIIALEEGQIIEVGDHRELMARQGLYSQLYRRQLELAVE